MRVYRIVKFKERTTDISGIGAYKWGGRWNSEGVFALYTSENEALALLEVIVHIPKGELPPEMFIMTIEIDESAPMQTIPDNKLPDNWRKPDNFLLKQIGDSILKENKVLGFKVRSAVLEHSYNYILNPQFAEYHNLVKVIEIRELAPDTRL